MSSIGRAAENLASREMIAQGFARAGGFWIGHDLKFRHRVVLSWFDSRNLQEAVARLRSEVGHQVKWKQDLVEKRPKENARREHEQGATRAS